MFGDKKKVELDPNEKLRELLEGLPALIQQSVTAGVSEVMKTVKQPQQPPAPLPPTVKVEEPVEQPMFAEGVDINELDNTAMLEGLTRSLDQKFESFGKELATKLDGISNKVSTNDLKGQVKDIAADNPDFWAHREVMTGLAKQYPALAPDDLYSLAKSKSPDIAEAYEKEHPIEKEVDTDPDRFVFGGLTPTAGLSTEDGEAMDFKSASESAWESTMSMIPDNIIGGGNN